MKWVKIAGLTLVGLVLIIFALMGYLYTTRGTPTKAVLPSTDSVPPPPIGDSAFLQSVELLTKTDLNAGHVVEPLFDGDGTYPRFWQDLRSARQSLILQMYYCKPGAVADSLKRNLLDAARRGVRIHALFDGFGAQSLSEEYLDSLRSAGVRVAAFRPVKWYTLHKAQNRSHVRVTVIDGTIAYTGGFGVADYWLGDGHSKEHWRETNVRFSGPAVRQLEAAFATAWAEATGELLTGWPHPESVATDGGPGATAGLLFAEPSLGSTAAERFLALTISGARKTLYITNAYFVPDDDFRRMLRAAARRGVDVRVLTAGKETDVKFVRLASRRHYEELMRAGVRVYEYRPTMLHSKTIVADDVWSTIGSMNFDNRSIAFNEEANLIVQDSAIARILRRQFEADLRFSQEIVPANFEGRGPWAKLLERLASIVSNLL
jgi:cardiolipin synthase A/B